MRKTGKFINYSTGEENYTPFIPSPLPPKPSLNIEQLYPLLDKASTSLGRLDGMRMLLPNTSLFLYMYVRKEAVLSSQIEGTQSSLSDLLLYENEEAPGVPLDDVTEVSNYVQAMNYGLDRLESLPLSIRLMKEIHGKLLQGSRGHQKNPGELRTSQNWIGGTRPGNAAYVPPPPDQVQELLGDLEKFIHDKEIKIPALIKAALVHVQFETIHPFLDGNGRLGRLLIPFILCMEGILKEPLLYLSLYFKTHRETYYQHLQNVRTKGDWETWIQFFLEGVTFTSKQATDNAQKILALLNEDREKIDRSASSSSAVFSIFNFLQTHPLSNTSRIKEECQVSLPTVLRSLKTLEDLGIVEEITGRERHKIFAYKEYLALLSSGTS